MVWFWLGAVALFGIVEMMTAGMVSVWFIAGALAGLAAALADGSLGLQMLLFALVSAAALALSRPLAKKFLAKPAVPTNWDRVLGMEAEVTETVDNQRACGTVYVDGKTWTARSVDGDVIPAGSRVRVQRVEGVKLFVHLVQKMEAAT